jgi:hypothetical protein
MKSNNFQNLANIRRDFLKQFLLNISFCFVSYVYDTTMELVRCFKEYRTRTRMNSVHEGKFRKIAAELRQTEAKLNEIPESRLTGVTALPVELWGIIIDTIVKESLGARCPHYPRYCVFPHELYLRLVCREYPPHMKASALDIDPIRCLR